MASRFLIFEEEETIPASPVQPKETAPVITIDDDEEDEVVVVEEPRSVSEPEETDEQRRLREEEESIELARMMEAEEAALVYHNQLAMLRENPDHFSEEDLAVFRAIEEQDRREEEERERAAELAADGEEEEEELSYDALLSLSERIGDVRTERWALVAQKHIDRLPLETYDAKAATSAHNDDSEVKCLVCQHEYNDQEQLRRLPCGHVFHAECVDEWLMKNDNCLYCRKCIVVQDDKE